MIRWTATLTLRAPPMPMPRRRGWAAQRSCCTTGCWKPTRTADGWEVVTEKGTVICEHLVNAGGLWAREIGAMAGVYLPLLPMAHQYLVTDDIPEIMDILKSGRNSRM